MKYFATSSILSRTLGLFCLWSSLFLLANSAWGRATILVQPAQPTNTDGTILITITDNEYPFTCVPTSLGLNITDFGPATSGVIRLTGNIPSGGCGPTITPYSLSLNVAPLQANIYRVEYFLGGLAASTFIQVVDATVMEDSENPITTIPFTVSLWTDHNQPGQDIFVWLQQNQAVGTWYQFDEFGQATGVDMKGQQPFDAIISLTQPIPSKAEPQQVGVATVDILPDNMAFFDYTFNDVSGNLTLTPFEFEANCIADESLLTFQGAWQDTEQPEMLVQIVQQGECIFGTWLFVDVDRYRWLRFGDILFDNESDALIISLFDLSGLPLGTPRNTAFLTKKQVGNAIMRFDFERNTASFLYTLQGELKRLDLVPFRP